MSLNHTRLAEGYKAAVETDARPGHDPYKKADGLVREAFADKGVRDNFDAGALFESIFGLEEWRACRSDRQSRPANKVFEAAGAVNTAMFSNIIGQWAYSAIMETRAYPQMVFQNVIPTRQTAINNERMPGVSAIGDEALVVDEAKEYPIAGVSENWTQAPPSLKRGFIVPVTWEALFFDRTQGALRREVTRLGESMMLNKEKRAIDCVIDAGETAQNKYRYRWLGNTLATYGDNSGTHNWDNLSASTALLDYTSLKTIFTLAQGLTDPYTGEPIGFDYADLIVPPSLVWTVPAVLGGQVNRLTPGYATSGNPINTNYQNPAGSILGSPRVLSSQLLQVRQTAASQAADTWFIGNISRAFEYVENLATEVTTAPAGSEAEFTKDIVLRTKVREMGTYSTVEPRAMIKATA